MSRIHPTYGEGRWSTEKAKGSKWKFKKKYSTCPLRLLHALCLFDVISRLHLPYIAHFSSSLIVACSFLENSTCTSHKTFSDAAISTHVMYRMVVKQEYQKRWGLEVYVIEDFCVAFLCLQVCFPSTAPRRIDRVHQGGQRSVQLAPRLLHQTQQLVSLNAQGRIACRIGCPRRYIS